GGRLGMLNDFAYAAPPQRGQAGRALWCEVSPWLHARGACVQPCAPRASPLASHFGSGFARRRTLTRPASPRMPRQTWLTVARLSLVDRRASALPLLSRRPEARSRVTRGKDAGGDRAR